mgnify:CR=1 FL=1
MSNEYFTWDQGFPGNLVPRFTGKISPWFRGIFGFHCWRLANMPQKIWMSFLFCGFLRSKNACTLLSLGSTQTTCSFFTNSLEITAPPSSNCSGMFSFEGFNFRFFPLQNSRKIPNFVFSPDAHNKRLYPLLVVRYSSAACYCCQCLLILAS